MIVLEPITGKINTLGTVFINLILLSGTKSLFTILLANQSEPFSVYRLPFVAC